MATRTRKPAAKPEISPAQVLEDGPVVAKLLADVTPEVPETIEPPVAANPFVPPVDSTAGPFGNDLSTLEAEPSREALIRQAAHRRFVARGMTPGDPVQDWLEAEAEVDGRRPSTD